MRIIAGKYGGRRLQVPKNNDVRPTSDKVRGAIFNALQAQGVVEGARVLDGFCGSGALGLEALSRGAVYCTFIDKARRSLELAKENASMLGALENCEFILRDASCYDPVHEVSKKYDVVFLDPPYRKGLLDKALHALHESRVLLNDTCCVVEAEKEFEPNLLNAFTVQSAKIYGDTQVMFLKYQA